MQDEICARIITELRDSALTKGSELLTFLLHSYEEYIGHPCFPAIEKEIGSILTSLPDSSYFFRFCEHETVHVDSFMQRVLALISDLISIRDYDSAADKMRYLLPALMDQWPPPTDERELRSFRDLVEYLFYMVVCEPNREVVIRSYTQTDILYHQGLLLLGMRQYKESMDTLRIAKMQSPVHAGILNAIAACKLAMIRSDMTQMAKTDDIGSLERIISLAFKTAWLGDELAHAFRNQGSLLALNQDIEGAIACYLIAETWNGSQEAKYELDLLISGAGEMYDPEYYRTHGLTLLSSRGIPTGPDPEIIAVLTRVADDFLEEQNLIKAREYLFRAFDLTKSDEQQDRIWRIERFMEDMVDY